MTMKLELRIVSFICGWFVFDCLWLQVMYNLVCISRMMKVFVTDFLKELIKLIAVQRKC